MKPLNVVAAYPRANTKRWLADFFPNTDLTKFVTVHNLLGFAPKDSYPNRAAAIAAQYLDLYGPTLLIGRMPALAFGMHKVDYFETHYREDAEITVVPNFSRHNEWWSDPANAERAIEFFGDLLEELKDEY